MKAELLNQIAKLKKEVLIFDVETSSHRPDGTPIDIRTEFDDYVKFAKCKWFGAFSYKYDEYYDLEFRGNESFITDLLRNHKFPCGMNSIEFDFPILKNNGVVPSKKYFNQLDLKVILGHDKFRGFKDRAALMGIDLPNNSLRGMAQAFNLEVLKGDIDYKIFWKYEWTPQEREEIIKYLRADVEVTKLLFERTWNFWTIFTQFLDTRNINNLSWIKSTVATVGYKNYCKVMEVEETYGDKSHGKEEMGGFVLTPKQRDAKKVWYVDWRQLYPHMIIMFNLCNEVDIKRFIADIKKDARFSGMSDDSLIDILQRAKIIFHKNDLFETKGYYDIRSHHRFIEELQKRIILRMDVKHVLKNIKNNTLQIEIPDSLTDIIKNKYIDDELIVQLEGLVYAIKILNNASYGFIRSSVFAAAHKPNAGWDTAFLGQQVNAYASKRFADFGFDTLYQDTDSCMIKHLDDVSEEYVQECLDTILSEILANVPFPSETFAIDIEGFLEYVKWSVKYVNEKQEDGTKKKVMIGKKKNYMYIKKNRDGILKLTIMGLPVKKSNGLKLSKFIFAKYLESKILKEGHANFSEEYLKNLITTESDVEGMTVLYNCRIADQYKPKDNGEPSSHINAQLSRAYTDGGMGGQVRVIKNKIVGRVGSAVLKIAAGKKVGKNDWYYGTLAECESAGVTVEDLDYTGVYNQLTPFYEGEKLK